MTENLPVPEADDDLLLLMYRAGAAMVAGEPDPRALAWLKPHLHGRVRELLAERHARRTPGATTVDSELDAVALADAMRRGDQETAETLRQTTADDAQLVRALGLVAAVLLRGAADPEFAVDKLRRMVLASEDQR